MFLLLFETTIMSISRGNINALFDHGNVNPCNFLSTIFASSSTINKGTFTATCAATNISKRGGFLGWAIFFSGFRLYIVVEANALWYLWNTNVTSVIFLWSIVLCGRSKRARWQCRLCFCIRDNQCKGFFPSNSYEYWVVCCVCFKIDYIYSVSTLTLDFSMDK